MQNLGLFQQVRWVNLNIISNAEEKWITIIINNSFFNNVNSSTNPEPINSNSFIQFEPNNGYDNNSTINNSINMQSNLNSTNNSIINDEELLKSFIGNNYDKITKKPFNFAKYCD